MKKQIIIFSLLLIVMCTSAVAQSNVFIDRLLEQKEALFGDAAAIALASAGLIPIDAVPEAAIKFLQENKWGLDKKSEETITLGELALLLMRAFNIGGGIMYNIFPGPRYACREFDYRGFVRRYPVPYRAVSGEEVLQIIGKVLTYREEVAQ